jgi:hypothetical protein
VFKSTRPEQFPSVQQLALQEEGEEGEEREEREERLVSNQALKRTATHSSLGQMHVESARKAQNSRLNS